MCFFVFNQCIMLEISGYVVQILLDFMIDQKMGVGFYFVCVVFEEKDILKFGMVKFVFGMFIEVFVEIGD